MGTGDCFLLKFSSKKEKFLMMIDCGSCVGGPQEFAPYVEDLAAEVKKEGGLDLLIVTHEHQDHVNGFHKCRSLFEDPEFEIREAWFAWTEHPADPNDRVADLQAKRKKMRMGFAKSLDSLQANTDKIINSFEGDYSKPRVKKCHDAFVNGLKTLAEINLEENFAVTGEPLAGMTAIKEILKKKKTKTQYVNPGEIRTLESAKGLKFYILGPPYSQDAIFKEGKQGKDVYKKYLAMNQSDMAADLFNAIPDDSETTVNEKRLPFESRYLVYNGSIKDINETTTISHRFGRDDDGNLHKMDYLTSIRSMVAQYRNIQHAWRRIDHDWLGTAGALALRLNSHINNTSLAMAVEFDKTGDVVLLPGDAEFGSWESWHLIKKWRKKGKNERPLAEDLLSRTVFYKVGHHLSYNGTALEKGIKMMPENGMASMVTLDRKRISSKWKSTMPNTELLKELIKRTDGKVFIMDEEGIKNPPSKFLDPTTLKKTEYEATPLYKQFTLKV
jgi:hypothetical protein